MRPPQLASDRVTITAINRRPPGNAIDLVGQQPQVDVVERKWQRHAQPEHAVRDLRDASRLRRVLERENQRRWQGCSHGEKGYRQGPTALRGSGPKGAVVQRSMMLPLSCSVK